jgi:hypothetical protein
VGGSPSATVRLAKDSPASTKPSPSQVPVVTDPANTLLVWQVGHFPAGFAEKVAGVDGVQRVAPVVSGTVWLTTSRNAAGRIVSKQPPGYSVPIELAGASPSQIAPFWAQSYQRYLPALTAGQGLIGDIESRIRKLGAGGRLTFGAHTVRVAGVVPDALLGMHELWVSLEEAHALGVSEQRYMLVRADPGTDLPRLASKIKALEPGALTAVRLPAQQTYLRQADSVLSPLQEKQYFGEFSARPDPARPTWLILDPAWVSQHLATQPVPILGSVTCNKAIFPLLRGALSQIAKAGLARLIHPSDYGGCFAPRLIPGDTGAAVAHHTWGTAIDINVSQNPWGGAPHQDPRVVKIFEKWGFTWGGNWMYPDGMHFEFIRWPAGYGPG